MITDISWFRFWSYLRFQLLCTMSSPLAPGFSPSVVPLPSGPTPLSPNGSNLGYSVCFGRW